MAVYTPLGAEELAALIARYDIGELVSAKGIAEGISNSNWLIDTDGRPGRFILTLYERRIDPGDLPYFLALLDHLAAKGCAVPATIRDREGRALTRVAGKAAALIAFMPGVSPSEPTPAQAFGVGAALARVHCAALDYPRRRADKLHPKANSVSLQRCRAGLAHIDTALLATLAWADEVVAAWPEGLPHSIIHSDLFPDNVLMMGDRVTGLIDFYFACDGMMAYDLAVTHAAWCFDAAGGHYAAGVGAALIAGYESVRPLTSDERAALPLLAQGACLRFVASRVEDWLAAAPGEFRKDPMAFVRRWNWYRENCAL